MTIIPTDLSSFLWGVAVSSFVAFGTGFVKKAGEDFYLWTKKKANPPPPEPIEVDRRFVPAEYKGGGCSWVPEQRIEELKERGYALYLRPDDDAPCFRVVAVNGRQAREFLMVASA
ncbi:hypothetical protein N0A02_26485 [Paraburkholderia acidicola]|uniref:Uncharacterized protein n=1 Tax=Paraburkholderia acidicola TaxID=1912599 RepID=A0ABV1LUS7_9BURK